MSTPPAICFVDTETTGLHDARQAWEFAAIRRDINGTETREVFFLDPSLSNADPAALAFSRYYERHPWALTKRVDAERSVIPLAGRLGPEVLHEDDAVLRIAAITHEAVLVGSNPAFDAATLAPLLKRYDQRPSWHYAVRDVVPLAAGYLAGQGHEIASWSSEDLSRAVGVDPDDYDRHTALGDCLWTRAIYDAVMTP